MENTNPLIPKERRKQTPETKGTLDNDGFFRTPNGSFGIVMVSTLIEMDLIFMVAHMRMC